MSKHDTLKSQWQPGQLWETLVEGCDQWVPVAEGGFAQPLWDERQDYRLAAPGEQQVSAPLGVTACPRCHGSRWIGAGQLGRPCPVCAAGVPGTSNDQPKEPK